MRYLSYYCYIKTNILNVRDDDKRLRRILHEEKIVLWWEIDDKKILHRQHNIFVLNSF